MQTLIDLLELRTRTDPERAPFVWLDEHDQESPLSYAALRARAAAIAAELASGGPGQRALLLYPPGLEFICGFFGCQLAGGVAIPAYPPDPARPQRFLDRLRSIVRDAGITRLLTTRAMLAPLREILEAIPELRDVEGVATDCVEERRADAWRAPDLSGASISVIQYTSGSTSDPKGVVIGHGNILANAACIERAFDIGPRDRMALWLPPYHDMGLFGAILQTLYSDMTTVLMSPLDFLRHPQRWLSAVSRHRATVSGGPNFAYDLAVRKISPEQRADLDLSSWRIAFNGAEPVRSETLEAFSRAFGPYGFRSEAFFPVYGLAEATLLVAAPTPGAPPRTLEICREHLVRNRVAEPSGSRAASRIPGCGRPIDGHRLEIVDPETRSRRGEGEVGEIWFQGPSVAGGYLGHPEESHASFEARLEDGSGPFLRTGDLGFLLDGELFVTGRRKDVLIVRGRNFYPQDVERVAEQASPQLRKGCSACFQLEETDADERVGLVAEISGDCLDRVDRDALFQELLAAVREQLDLQLDAIALVEPRSIPKTSSGKLQRRACRDALRGGFLRVLAGWTRPAAADAGQAPPSGAAGGFSVGEVQRWLAEHIAAASGLPLASIDPHQDFAHFGLDSVLVADLVTELELWLGCPIPDELMTAPDVASLATAAAGLRAARPTPAAHAKPERRVPQSGVRPRLVPGGAGRSNGHDWEHASPLRFLNGPGRDVFARTDGYARMCESVQRDRLWSFGLTRIAERDGLVLYETHDGERRWAVDLATHDYLGLTVHPDVVDATRRAVAEFGVGSSGASMLNGNTPIHRQLERELAEWLGKEAVVLCPSGFSMMSAVTAGILRPSDVVFFDHYSHASLLDGISLSGARSIRFPHNDVDALERLLARYRDEGRGAVIVTDGVCSTDGSIAPVAELVALARRYEARLVIDDAHGIGTLGDGRGVTAGHDVDLVGGVLSKALGACGGFVAGERRVVDYLRFFGRSACATTNVSVANAAAALAALRVLRAEPGRVAELGERVARLREALGAAGVPVDASPAPIVSIVCGRDADAYRAWREILEMGVMTQALPFPIVPRDGSRIRARVSHRLDPEVIDDVAAAIAEGTRATRRPVTRGVRSARLGELHGFEQHSDACGARVHVRPGAPPWRVFLHPLLFGTREIYADLLARYDGPHGVVAVDWWGHGEAPPAPAGGVTLEQMADELAAILERLGVRGACRLVGTSMGAMTALRFAASHPDRVASSLLIGGSADPEEGPARRFFEALLDVAAELGTSPVVDDVLTSMFSSQFRGEQPERLQAFLELLARRDPRAAAPCIQAVLGRQTLIDALPGIHVPSVVLVGEEDLAEPVGHSERMAERLPDAALRVVPRCGHLVPVERPEAVLQVLREWDAQDAARALARRGTPGALSAGRGACA